MGSGFPKEVILGERMPARVRLLKAKLEPRQLHVSSRQRKEDFTCEMSCSWAFQQRSTMSLIRSAPSIMSEANSRWGLQQRSEEKRIALQPERRDQVPSSFEAETLGKVTHHLASSTKDPTSFPQRAPPFLPSSRHHTSFLRPS